MRSILVLILFLTACASTKSNKNLALIKAAEKGDLLKVKELITQGADINAEDENGWTAYLIASSNGKFEVSNFLKGLGAYIYTRNEKQALTNR